MKTVFQKSLFLSGMLCLASAHPGLAEDWPTWGGTPNRNMVGEATSIPTDFKPGTFKGDTEEIDMATTEKVKWVAKLGSQSYGNPVIVDGRVFVGTNNESPRDPDHVGDRGIIYCFDEATGEFKWQLIIPKLGAGKVSDWEYIGVCSSPVVKGDRLWVVTNRCEVVCLDVNGMADGNDGPFQDEGQYIAPEGSEPAEVKDTHADIIWVFDMRDELGVFPHNVASCSPLYYEGKIYTSTSNGVDWSHTNIPAPLAPTLICLDAETGELLGEDFSGISTRVLHCSWSSPALAKVDGETQIVFGGGDGFVYGFKPQPEPAEDGLNKLPELWRIDANPPEYRPEKYATFGGPSEVLGTVVAYQDKIYTTIGQDPEHGDGVGALTCIDPKLSGEHPHEDAIWSFEEIGRSMSTPSIVNDLVFTVEYAGIVHCVDALTGEQYWTYDLKSRVWSSTLVADGKVIVGDEDGDLTMLSADKEGKKLAEINLGAPIYGSPVVANDVLYIANQTHLYAIDASGGGEE